MNKLLFISHGLTNPIGKRLIRNELKLDGDLKDKKIFVFHEPHEFLRDWIIEILCEFGFQKSNIIMSAGPELNEKDVLNADIYYVTEGNTFEVMYLLRERGADRLIKEGMSRGNKIYVGASAGAAIAGVSISEIQDFDKNFVRMTDFTGLALFDGIIIPHYTKEELARYIKYTPGIENRYNQILSVANTRKLVMYV